MSTATQPLPTSMKTIIGLIWLAFAAAGALHYAHVGFAAFVAATLALGGLAWLVSFATEELGTRLSPAATGLMQSTLGNLPEFFVVVFALIAGQTVVAQTAVVGSIFANALFVLGLAMIAGASVSSDGVMRFGTRLPSDTATLTLLALFTITLVSIAVADGAPAADNAGTVSAVAAVIILATYLTWVVSYIRGGAAAEPHHDHPPRMSMNASIGLLALTGVAAAFVSHWFVEELEPAIETLGVSEAFAGLVIVAIAGNAVENATGVILAARGRAELAISVVKNSVAQIAAFLFPLLVLVSLFVEAELTFQMEPVFVGALAVTALVVWQVTQDGAALVWEGVALCGIYIVLATFVLDM